MPGLDFIRDLAVVMGVAGAVGWICQRLGLSLVVGYLAAGAIIGPFTPPFQLVSDLERVQVLAQVGLVFLIFSIGLDLSFARLRRLGLSIVLATTIGAVLVFNGCRLFGTVAGWSGTQSLFLAGMLMVSSSAIISKVLQELNIAHRRDGQLALGITVMEDTVAVVMLTVLSTLIQFGGRQSPPLAEIVGGLTAFMVVLLLSALFFIPRLLLRLAQTGRAEVRTIIVIALLFFLAWLAQRAGYSMALGAFLLGVVVASTPQRPEIERVFEGLRDMFGAVFFVAMGMLVDFRLLAPAWPLVLGVTAFALVCRSLAASVGLVLAGNETRESIRAGLSVTPLGEFSFIVAQMGVAAGVLPPQFFPVAVGSSLLTSLAAPVLMRRSGAISAWVDHRLPLMVREWIAFYHSWQQQLVTRRQRSFLWKLTGRRLVQAGVGILLISGLILFARPLFAWIRTELGDDWPVAHGTAVMFWSMFGIVVLAPLVAIWRNVEALGLIVAEWVTRDSRRAATLRPLVERALRMVAASLLAIWLLSLMPFGKSVLSGFLGVLAVMLVAAALLWRRLIYWQSKLEVELQTQLQAAVGGAGRRDLKQLLEEQQDVWQLQAEEYVLPEFSASAGRSLGELALRSRLGCSVASIDRHGLTILNPSADAVLYPSDKLMLLGNAAQIDLAMAELGAPRARTDGQELEELSLETLRVPNESPLSGRTLRDLDLFRKAGVQVAGIQRGSKRIITPGGHERLASGDLLLILGTPKQIRELEIWLSAGKLPAATPEKGAPPAG
jgi:CPA2 family monovalent cation:H+ antiporter-2